MKPRRRLLLRALSAVLGVSGGVLLCELVARLAFPAAGAGFRVYQFAESERGKFCEFDETLGWRGIPRAEDFFEWIDARCRVRQNAEGFRGREVPFARTGKERWVALGDSYVWGYGVEEEELFTELLAKDGLEVVNLGVSGYGTDQEYLLWKRRGSRWAPDRVLLFIDFNTDLQDIVSAERYGHSKPMLRFARPGGAPSASTPKRPVSWEERPRKTFVDRAPVAHWLLAHSRTASLFAEALSRSAFLSRKMEEAQIVPAMRSGYLNEYPLYASRPVGEVDKAWKQLEAILRALDSDVKKSKAKLTVVLVPSPVQVYPELWERFVAANPFPSERLDPDAPDRRFEAIAARLGVRVLNPLPAFKEAAMSRQRLYFPLNYHWTPEGHRLIADLLLKDRRNETAK